MRKILTERTPEQARRKARYRLVVEDRYSSSDEADRARRRMSPQAGRPPFIAIWIACPYCGHFHDCGNEDDREGIHLCATGCRRYFLKARDEPEKRLSQ